MRFPRGLSAFPLRGEEWRAEVTVMKLLELIIPFDDAAPFMGADYV
jgi:hypothetical protein